MTIDRHVFRPDAVAGAVIFRLPGPRGGWTYVTDQYVDAVLGTDLQGADFDLVWTLPA
jgi:expansin (peptidoglycan-binding protein)